MGQLRMWPAPRSGPSPKGMLACPEPISNQHSLTPSRHAPLTMTPSLGYKSSAEGQSKLSV